MIHGYFTKQGLMGQYSYTGPNWLTKGGPPGGPGVASYGTPGFPMVGPNILHFSKCKRATIDRYSVGRGLLTDWSKKTIFLTNPTLHFFISITIAIQFYCILSQFQS